MTDIDERDEFVLRSMVPSIVDEIVARVHPVRVILFGSVARGDERADSDLDLLVVLEHVDRTQQRALDGPNPVGDHGSGVDRHPCDRRRRIRAAQERERLDLLLAGSRR